MRAVVRATGERLILRCIGLFVDDEAFWLTDAGMLVSERSIWRIL